MPQYAANYYTGANVSLFMGSNLLTQAYGLTWSDSDPKRPIYGYNSQYWDGWAEGQYIAHGQLYVNVVKANYLPTVLKRYHQFTELIRQGSRSRETFVDDVASYLQADYNTRPLLRVLRDLVDVPVLENGGGRGYSLQEGEVFINQTVTALEENPSIGTQTMTSDTEQDLDYRLPIHSNDSVRRGQLDSALDYIFENEDVRSDLINVFTGGLVTSEIQYHDTGINFSESTVRPSNELNSIIERSVHRDFAGRDLMETARPSQFGSPSQGPRGVDLSVQFGPPVGEVTQNAAFMYQDRTNFTLRDCLFVGSAGEIMSDSQGLMEVYNFISRKRDLVPQSTNNSNW